jgi:hypothetical protein
MVSYDTLGYDAMHLKNRISSYSNVLLQKSFVKTKLRKSLEQPGTTTLESIIKILTDFFKQKVACFLNIIAVLPIIYT